MNIVSFLKHFYGFLIHIIFLSIVALLVSVGIFHEPHVSTSILIIIASIIIILLVLLIISWVTREYDNIYKDEKHAKPAIEKALKSYRKYEYLRICGASCTSIFNLFNEYSDAIANGKRVCVFMLNPDDERIIDHLSDCEHDKSYLIDIIQKNFDLLEDQMPEQQYNKIKGLLHSDDCYGKKLITASLLLWLAAHAKAKKKNKGLSNGLEIFLYSHLPNLKAWIFGDSFIFIGSYNPLPGGVGISNPIKFIKGKNKNRKQIIQDCRKVTNFLIDHPQTKRIKTHV